MPDNTPRIVVKLMPDVADVPYQDAAQETLTGFAAETWTSLTAAFPALGLSLNRLLRTQSADQVRALMDLAQARSGEPAPDLMRLMAVDVAGNFDAAALVAAVQALPFVELAFLESATSQPVNPADDPLAVLQTHLLPAPFGLGVLHAWNIPGADGANVRFLDIEYGWDLTHEDLAGAGVAAVNASVPGHEWHSTACLGIVLAQDNDRGVIGVAPRVTAGIVSALRPTLPDAFVAAAGFLQAGDVLLVEVQEDGRRPVEIDPHITMLIGALTLMGIIVVEPAGNGPNGLKGFGADLDAIIRADGTGFQRGSFNFVDSGAIVVGARQALTRSRISSTFGSRVDCHAIGEAIVTTSTPGPPYRGVVPGTGFGGTSGASAIIAGAAVVMQGIARARGTTLTPDRMRNVLSDPALNTLTDNPAADRIGVMPDLEQVAQHI